MEDVEGMLYIPIMLALKEQRLLQEGKGGIT